MKHWVRRLLESFGLALVSVEEKQSIRNALLGKYWLQDLFKEAVEISGKSVILEGDWIELSQSQLGQDLLALATFGPERKGFFVEFGATDGKTLSNTWFLEKYFGWTGILAEPARVWKDNLLKERDCSIDLRCVYKQSGELVTFSETSVGELSTISKFSESDMHASSRRKSLDYFVETVTLHDLLLQHRAPKFIDFLSIDTEGSEFEILENFDFSKFDFGLICIEHNFTPQRALTRALLQDNGYMQILNHYSKFDDWYIPKDKLGETMYRI